MNTMTDHTSIRPITFDASSPTDPRIGGVSVSELVNTYGTPLYVMDVATLRHNCLNYIEPLKQEYPNHLVVFAGKANLNRSLLNCIQPTGMGVEVVSGGELFTALRSTIPAQNMLFHGNNKSNSELKMAIEYDIRIVVDNLTELSNVIEQAELLHRTARVLIRLKPEIEAHTHDYIKTGQIDSKFGIRKEELLDAVRQCDHPLINFLGLHGHIGSQIFDEAPYLDLVDIMVGHMQTLRSELGISVAELDLGGGFGIRYTESDDPPAVRPLVTAMAQRLKAACQSTGLPLPLLILEPGRSIVGNAGITLYEVGSIKTIPNIKEYLFVDGGMADNPRPAMYGSKYTFDIANKLSEPKTKHYDIAGKFCESGDILGKQVPLQAAGRGDILMVYGTGAYNYAMSSNYNRFCRPAMVAVENGASSIWIARETFEDLVKNDA